MDNRKANQHHWIIFLGVAFLPILTALFSIVLVSGASDELQQKAVADNASSSPGVLSAIILMIGIALALSKITAIVGIWLRWYFTWIFHAVEVQLITFIMGLVVVISAFSLEFTLQGLAKLLSIFLFLYVNMLVREFWNGKRVRDSFYVNYFSGSHH